MSDVETLATPRLPDDPTVWCERASCPGPDCDCPPAGGVCAEHAWRHAATHLAADVERLRQRSHQIQAQEMAKRADLDAQVARLRQRWDTARKWTEDAGLLAEWAHGDLAGSPFWALTSEDARDAVARLVAERDDAAAARTADEVWAWLLACTVCGDEHEFRRVEGARDAWNYRHPVDGHQPLTRAGSSFGAIRRLRDEWRRRETR